MNSQREPRTGPAATCRNVDLARCGPVRLDTQSVSVRKTRSTSPNRPSTLLVQLMRSPRARACRRSVTRATVSKREQTGKAARFIDSHPHPQSPRQLASVRTRARDLTTRHPRRSRPSENRWGSIVPCANRFHERLFLCTSERRLTYQDKRQLYRAPTPTR